MAERFKALVLKTSVGKLTVGSNPSLSANINKIRNPSISLSDAPLDNCHPNYVGVCLPVDNDVRCKDIPYKRFQWVNSDPYKLDRDGDGICCES